MKTFFYYFVAAALLSACVPAKKQSYDIDSVTSPKSTEVFQPDWENIAANYQFPEWFTDGKFGIFIHWGPYAVPAFDNEWYPRNMYLQESKVYEHHINTWGPQDKFGYKDFVAIGEWRTRIKDSPSACISDLLKYL
jgi:alpha-L-fucosidase